MRELFFQFNVPSFEIPCFGPVQQLITGRGREPGGTQIGQFRQVGKLRDLTAVRRILEKSHCAALPTGRAVGKTNEEMQDLLPVDAFRSRGAYLVQHEVKYGLRGYAGQHIRVVKEGRR